ncbi:hypothetical protein A2U01_0109968, partial [Trifolium medium]|nr:hypothetical protein [Trifolium medium]
AMRNRLGRKGQQGVKLVGKEVQDHHLLKHKKNNKVNFLMLRISW